MSRWIVLALVTLSHAFGALSVLAVAPLAPFLLESLQLTRVEVGLFLPAVYLGGVLMSLPSGWLTDRIGVRMTLGGGQVIIAVMVVVAAMSGNLPTFLACLVLAGFGFSVLNPSTGKAVIEWFPPTSRGFAMGVKQTGLTMGALLAALTMPPLALYYGWRTALVCAGALSLVSSMLVLLLYRTPTLSTTAGPKEWPRISELGVFFKRPGVVILFISGFLLSTAQSSVLGYLALYAKETFTVSAVVAGQILAMAQVGGTLSRLAWGAISDRYFGGRRRPGVVISALMGAVAYTLFALGDGLPSSMILPVAFLAGAGAFGWVGLYFALAAEIGGARYAGLLTGVAVAFSWSGVLFGPPVFGLVLQASGSYRISWLILAGVAVAVAIVLPRLKPLVNREPK